MKFKVSPLVLATISYDSYSLEHLASHFSVLFQYIVKMMVVMN